MINLLHSKYCSYNNFKKNIVFKYQKTGYFRNINLFSGRATPNSTMDHSKQNHSRHDTSNKSTDEDAMNCIDDTEELIAVMDFTTDDNSLDESGKELS